MTPVSSERLAELIRNCEECGGDGIGRGRYNFDKDPYAHADAVMGNKPCETCEIARELQQLRARETTGDTAALVAVGTRIASYFDGTSRSDYPACLPIAVIRDLRAALLRAHAASMTPIDTKGEV